MVSVVGGVVSVVGGVVSVVGGVWEVCLLWEVWCVVYVFSLDNMFPQMYHSHLSWKALSFWTRILTMWRDRVRGLG